MKGARWLWIPVILNVWIEGYLRLVMNWVAPILHLFSAAKNEFSHEQSLLNLNPHSTAPVDQINVQRELNSLHTATEQALVPEEAAAYILPLPY